MACRNLLSTTGPLPKGTLAAAALVFAAGTAGAQNNQIFKVSHLFNSTVYPWDHGGKVFTDAVEKAAGDRVKFQVFPPAQLGKDLIGTLNSGLADIAIIP